MNLRLKILFCKIIILLISIIILHKAQSGINRKKDELYSNISLNLYLLKL